ncbi:Lmo0850 family protein [Siminovitchia acidinfaciens]|uniref:Lmo0850 family protein n=1 Tax=Siminovitchia acidinfaciens TaxID=2321395 RepID=UPI0013E07D3C|nr:Lmo0850 family protein [Siminovitchia acidinfaciens]
MHRDHEQLEKFIDSLAEMGVNISVTKSRLELFKVLDEIQAVPGYTEYHLD